MNDCPTHMRGMIALSNNNSVTERAVRHNLYLGAILAVLGCAVAHANVTDITNPASPVVISNNSNDDALSDASFDCKKASTNAEKLICRHDDLAELDQKMAALYRGLSRCFSKEEMTDIRLAQKAWITNRASCATLLVPDDPASEQRAMDCIAESINKRIVKLESLNAQCFIVSASTSNPTLSVYRNKRYGFEITFPKGMRLSSNFAGSYFVQGGVWSQEDLRSGQKGPGIPVVRIIAYPPSGDPRVEVRIGVHPGTSSITACGWDKNASIPDTQLNEPQFRRFNLSNAGMMKFFEGESYQTFNKGYCFALERLWTGSNYYDEDTKQQVQKANAMARTYYEKTEPIVKSFKFE